MATASLEILTGPARGTASWLSGPALDVLLDDEDTIRVVEAGGDTHEQILVARLHRADDSYEIEARGDSTLWVNGERTESRLLEQRDLIEFGDSGPLSRYRSYRQGDRLRRSLGDMLADCIDYTRVSRKPRFARLQKASGSLLYDVVLRTTFWFRVMVIVALVALSWISYQQYRASLELQRQAESSAGQLEEFARTLTRTSEEALRPADLNRLRQELGQSLSTTAERLQSLEQRSAAAGRIIATASPAIVFLQGAYGYRDVESQKMLRYQVDADGNPLFSLRGQPLFSLEGDGEIAQLQFTGTAFVVSSNGALLTNRHVAIPWEDDAALETMRAGGMEPVLIRFIGFIPDTEGAFPVELLKASAETDLAVLVCDETISGLNYLEFGTQLPRPGDEVIVMGYPTGLRSMVAQTGAGFVEELQDDAEVDFWGVAERLSREKFIRPLASRGIVGQRTEAILVYDAETTSGGSGGPVLDINGKVVAINTAIIPEYGGSNFGVPVDWARQLLDDAGIVVE